MSKDVLRVRRPESTMQGENAALRHFEPAAPDDLSSVSVIIPMRNEERHISRCVATVLAQDFPGDLEVLIVDGMSEDRSRTIVDQIATSQPSIRVLDNPRGTTPAAMNIGIQHARGDVIVRVDAHTTIAPDYVRRCVDALRRTRAGNVGGLQRAVAPNYVGEAIALTMASPLAVGDARYRYAEEASPVDTVYLGAFPRTTFERVGLYNESLERNQDYELNYRIRKAGLTVYLDPRIRSWYRGRTSLQDFCKQYFQYGRWKVQMLGHFPGSLRWRQLAPPTFVASLVASGLLQLVWDSMTVAFRLIGGGYLVLATAFTLRTAQRHGLRYLPILPITFASMHFSWGTGFIVGLLTRIVARPGTEPSAENRR